MSTPQLVLASASPRRRELLAQLCVAFETAAADVDETVDERDPERAAEALARRKAAAGARDRPCDVVVGSDTIVAVDGELLGKPADAEEARRMLRALRDRAHAVATGVAVALGATLVSHAERVRVRMRDYTDTEIEAWIATGEPFDKAGAYAIQDATFRPVAGIEGCECAVIGLPLWSLRELLHRAGLDVPPPALERCARCPDRPTAER